MELSTTAVAFIHAADAFTIYSEDKPEGTRYFVLAEVGRIREVLHNEDGTPRVSATKADAMEPVLALRPELDSGDFAAGYVTYGPYADDTSQESRKRGTRPLPEKTGAL